MENNKNKVNLEKIDILDRKKIEVFGVYEILSSTNCEVIAKLNDVFLNIFGENLSVSKLSPEEKYLLVTGDIMGIKYQTKRVKKSFFKRLFK